MIPLPGTALPARSLGTATNWINQAYGHHWQHNLQQWFRKQWGDDWLHCSGGSENNRGGDDWLHNNRGSAKTTTTITAAAAAAWQQKKCPDEKEISLVSTYYCFARMIGLIILDWHIMIRC
jgi:hypothetical protein